MSEKAAPPAVADKSWDKARVRAEIKKAETERKRSLARTRMTKTQIDKLHSLVREQEERLRLNTRTPWAVGIASQCPELQRTDSNEEIFHEGVVGGPEATSIKTYIFKLGLGSRAQYFFPNAGLCSDKEVKPNTFVALHQHSYCPLEILPPEYDPRVKSMEVEERPDVRGADLGGLEKQICELNEVVLSLNNPELFKKIGIVPPKGILLFGPPGTGKTMLARMVAAECKATFLRLSGTSLIQMYIGEGAKIVRDAFQVARDKSPSVIFIDEIDSVGKKRTGEDADKIGNREVSRTLMELLNQLDGFQPSTSIKVIAATNRLDVLDPALVRSGRLDRKVEIPAPDEKGRAMIMKIHSRKMNLEPGINFEELAQETDGFNGAQCRAVAVEAGMRALRRSATLINHEDFVDGIRVLKEKKKVSKPYFA